MIVLDIIKGLFSIKSIKGNLTTILLLILIVIVGFFFKSFIHHQSDTETRFNHIEKQINDFKSTVNEVRVLKEKVQSISVEQRDLAVKTGELYEKQKNSIFNSKDQYLSRVLNGDFWLYTNQDDAGDSERNDGHQRVPGHTARSGANDKGPTEPSK